MHTCLRCRNVARNVAETSRWCAECDVYRARTHNWQRAHIARCHFQCQQSFPISRALPLPWYAAKLQHYSRLPSPLPSQMIASTNLL